MLVRVRGKGVKLNGVWKYKNEEVEIDEIEFEENKEYLDIIKDEETEKLPQIPNENDKDDEDEELLKLRKKAKELGIARANLMGEEKLRYLIAEKEAPLFGAKKEEKPDNTDTGSNDNGTDIDNPDADNNDYEVTGENNTQE